MPTIAPLLAAALLLADAAPAFAGCYKDIGCTSTNRFRTSALRRVNCERLISLRNSILSENGFCFQDPAAIEAFSNDECQVKDITKLPLNDAERTNVRTINKIEAEKGCQSSQ